MFDELCRHLTFAGEQPVPTSLETEEAAARCDVSIDYAQAGWGHGRQRSLADPELVVTVVDARLDRPLRGGFEMMQDVLLVRASVDSACSYSQPGNGRWDFARPELTVSFLPRGTSGEVLLEPSRQHTAVTLLIAPRALVSRCGLRREDLPAPLLRAIDGEITQPAPLFTLPVEPAIASLVDDLVASRLTGRLRAMQMRARGLELVALMCAAWNDALQAGANASMRGRDAQLIAAARRILTQRLVDPPTLQELARELGTNRNKLNQLFQRGLGVSPKAFCVQRRIEHAQVLLREGRLNVAQIAETVGYQHQSSFAAAFRGAVGVCPRDYVGRRQPSAAPALAAA